MVLLKAVGVVAVAVPGALDGQEGQGEHRGGDVPVPGGPLADLVLAEPGELFAPFVALFDLPADAGLGDELDRRRDGGGVGEEVAVLVVESALGQLFRPAGRGPCRSRHRPPAR